jgi:hypothetical protein
MKTEIVIPTTLSEIPLMNYQKFIKLVEGSNDEELIAQKSIEIFCGLNMKDVLQIKWSDVVGLANHFNELFQQKTDFKTTFKIKGMEFGFIPNLEDMSFGEYVDLDHNIGKIESFHKAMAVLYRPITKKTKDTYEIMPYSGTDEFSELMKYAPLDIAMAASVFFYRLGNDLVQATLTSLEQEMTKNKELNTIIQNGLSSISNGDGIILSMHSLKEMLQSLTKLPNWEYGSALPTLLTSDKELKLNNEN